MEFFVDLWSNPILRHAALSGVLASVACGFIGSFVVARRISYLAGGIAHFTLAGMGAAYYLHVMRGWAWLSPLHGALAAAALAAVIIGLVSLRAQQREDTVIGGLWAIGMAVGVLFVSRTEGYNQDLMSYLFGSQMIAAEDLRLLAALDAVVLAVGLVCFKQFVAVCFDEEFARLRGLNVEFYFLLLLILTALTAVLLATVVGIVMMIALLTLPAAVAGQFTNRLGRMMALATVLCVVFTIGGQAISYGPELPAGATIIVFAGAVYFGTLFARRVLFRRVGQV